MSSSGRPLGETNNCHWCVSRVDGGLRAVSSRWDSQRRERLRLRLSPIVHLGASLDGIVVELDGPDLLFDQYAHRLLPLAGLARVADDVTCEYEVFCLAANANSGRFFRRAVVLDDVCFKAISVPTHRLGFVAEADSGFVVSPDLVTLDEVVRVFVANRDPESSIVFQHVVLKDSVPHAPERALQAGALGYITKDQATDKIVEGIRRVMEGKVYVSDAMTETMLRRTVGEGPKQLTRSPIDALANRELEVFRHIGQGEKTAGIAKRMHLSVKTIETYRDRIRVKLALSDGTELAHYATQWMLENG